MNSIKGTEKSSVTTVTSDGCRYLKKEKEAVPKPASLVKNMLANPSKKCG